ncbi:LacI family DNA-binding transcriptional regulator [Piscinibacter terrae]|nr:LacI family DNA-binding transcriptional regulator [Albitalea terrae]
MHDVASSAGVSVSTVSLVLQDSQLISLATKTRVRRAVEELGYVYNRSAAQLRRHDSNAVGVIVNDLANPFFVEVLAGIEGRLMQDGFVVLVANTDNSCERQDAVLRSMREQGVAGVMLAPSQGTRRQALNDLRSWRTPFVLMVRSLGMGGCDFAGFENEMGSYLATQRMLQAGHRKLAYLGGLPSEVRNQRYRGFLKALRQYEVSRADHLEHWGAATRQFGFDGLHWLLRRQPGLEGVVCYNDIVAFGAIAAASRLGRRPGVDIAVAGFDDIRAAQHLNPPLTTISIDPHGFGAAAAQLWLQRRAAPEQAQRVHLSLPKLVVRRTA